MKRIRMTKRRLLLVALPAALVVAGGGGIAYAATAHGDGDANDKPTYHSTITTGIQDDSGNEAAQQFALTKLAKVNLSDAATAAQDAVPGGKVTSIDLSNEGGNVVYTAEVVTAGSQTEVVVDAGSGKVLAKTAEQPDPEGQDGTGSSDSNSSPAPASSHP